MSAPYVVVAGYRSKGEKQVEILTLAGDRIRVASEHIIHSAKAEAGGSAELFFIERDAEIFRLLHLHRPTSDFPGLVVKRVAAR
jgi:hypothetical protein